LDRAVGSSYYISPEVIDGKYDEKCDIWSCGVILYILLSGHPPFVGRNDREVLQKVKSHRIDYSSGAFKHVSKEAIHLLKRMLEKNPKVRATATEILDHEWFRKCKNDTTIENNPEN
jgi:calcium-dependent protein kinase